MKRRDTPSQTHNKVRSFWASAVASLFDVKEESMASVALWTQASEPMTQFDQQLQLFLRNR
jgi:hypothetical protein